MCNACVLECLFLQCSKIEHLFMMCENNEERSIKSACNVCVCSIRNVGMRLDFVLFF